MTIKAKQKKCKECGTLFTPYSSTTQVCSTYGIECAIKHAEGKRLKLDKKRKTIEKKQHREALEAIKPKSYWLKQAQFWFNKFIRMRDENKACISGGRGHTGQRHAGHFRSVGSAPHLRFDERNCHGQCAHCNNFLSGNLIEYRKALVERIGQQEVDALINDNEPKHYTIDDIKKIRDKYKQKCKELEA
jgi:hypothetical protein